MVTTPLARVHCWRPQTAQSGIRQVLDTGAKSNMRRARKKGADVWVDAWLPSPAHNSWGSTVTPLAVIPNE